MKVVKPSFEIIDSFSELEVLKKLEKCGRVCYKSEDRITKESAHKFIEHLIKNHHESVIEHFSFTVKMIVDRGVSHEIVRHRLVSYSQESTRYCNYSKGQFNGEITVIEPCFTEPWSTGYDIWYNACLDAERNYFKMLDYGFSPEEARSVLPNSLKTEIVMTTNIREWRHFFKVRTAHDAHPQIREIANMLLDELKTKLPILFDDLGCKHE